MLNFKMLVNFKLNKNLDKEIIYEFLNTYAAGVDFSESIIRLHPGLKKAKNLAAKEKKLFVSRYVDDYYSKNLNKLQKKLISFDSSWRKIEREYFKEISEVFNLKREIKKNYTAFISVINTCPRWISKKTFQIGMHFSIKDSLQTVCHEITHFFFYDYMKKFPNRLTSEEKWNFSEIFNVVLLNLPKFSRLYSPVIERGYPAHEKYFVRFKKLYKSSRKYK